MSHNQQKKIAVINDFTGFGKCSLTVQLPILSAMKVQCCPVPTAIFSNHTGYPSFFWTDYTEHLHSFIEEWEKLDLSFEGICSGYLGSAEQVDLVEYFFKRFKTEKNLIIVDPVMGDSGKIYSAYTEELCQKMKKLVTYANLITPNLTEACVLADWEYQENISAKKLEELAKKMVSMGPEKVVITGISQGKYISNYCYEVGKGGYFIKTARVGIPRCGTGDVFTSILAADAVNEVPFESSVRKASLFVKKCIQRAEEMKIPDTDGVPFEELLSKLK